MTQKNISIYNETYKILILVFTGEKNMAIPLLRTKFYIPPPQPGLVHRPRLTQLINENLNRKLTLISAPAGFGKTTLLSEWILTSPRRVAWLSLESADNDPARFWSYIMAALEMLQENLVKDSLAFLQTQARLTELAQTESFITVLLNDLSAFPDQFALALDDYHRINNQVIHDGIAFLINHLPPGMHLIITCRADPPLPLASLRAHGQMIELRAVDLRFATDEIDAFLNQITKLSLPADQIAALESRTEGWIAGLQLAAISLQKRQDAAEFIESFTGSHRFILDYLVDEVLNCQPEDVQSFLLDTSILERFTGPLCDALTGRNDGQERLRQLEQANLFIIPLDDERRWYRYHSLFADLLRSRLQELKPDQLPVLHRRACDWFEREGLLPEAIHHAVVMEDFERAAQLIEKATEMLRQRGEIATLTRWMNALPAEIRRSHPSLCLAYARALVDTAQNISIETLVDDAEAGLEVDQFLDDLSSASLRGQMAAMRAYLAMIQHRYGEAIQLSHLARKLLGDNETRWRSFVNLILAGAYRFTDDWAAAGPVYLEASELSQSAGDRVNALTALSMWGEVLEAQGHLHQSVEQFERVLQLAQAYEISNAPVTGYALVGLGRVWYEWNDLQASINFVQDGIQRSKKGDIKDILLRGQLALARIQQAQHDMEGTWVALENAQLAAKQMGVPEIKDWVDAFWAQTWLAQGESERAIGWALKYSGDLYDQVFPSIAIALARVRLAQGKPEEALGLLEHALQSAQAVGRLGNAVQILVVKAIVQHVLGELENSLATLSSALALAEPEGYLRVFLDEGEPMRLLIADFKAMTKTQIDRMVSTNREISIDYLNKILAAFPDSSSSPFRESIVDDLQSSIPDPLSERELEVLHLMAAGLSNRDIARRDVVSINTVKTQVKSIYGKLGAHTRADALMTARRLGLL
jgi:LuxR family maltose regulon positive regulatory protein